MSMDSSETEKISIDIKSLDEKGSKSKKANEGRKSSNSKMEEAPIPYSVESVDDESASELLEHLQDKQLFLTEKLSACKEEDINGQMVIMRQLTLIQSTIISLQNVINAEKELSFTSSQQVSADYVLRETSADAFDVLSEVPVITEKVTQDLFSTLNEIVTSPIDLNSNEYSDSDDEFVSKKIKTEIRWVNKADEEDENAFFKMQSEKTDQKDFLKDPSKKRNYNVAKALHILGDVRLIPAKAQKVLGLYMTDEEERKLYRMDSKDNLVETLKLLSLPELRVKPKAIQVLGEPMLAGEKANSLLQSEKKTRSVSPSHGHTSRKKKEKKIFDEKRQDLDENGVSMKDPFSEVQNSELSFKVVRNFEDKKAAVEMPIKATKVLGDYDITPKTSKRMMNEPEIPFDIERMKMYTLPDVVSKKSSASTPNKFKVVQLTGESMIAGPKVSKILGAPMSPEQIRKQKDAALIKESVDHVEVTKRKMMYTAPEAKKINAKAIALLGEKMLACEKAKRILGDHDEDEDIQARKKASSTKEIEVDYLRKRLYSAPEPGSTNAKAMALLGETLLAAEKVQKILGSNERDEEARRMASLAKDPEIDYHRKRLYSAPDPGLTNAKAIALLGETLLAAEKAQKILGSNEKDEEARKLASLDKEIETDYKRKSLYSAPEPGSTNAKAMQLLGETILAAEKAQKVLGSNERDEEARKLAATDKEIEVDYKRKSLYSAPDPGSTNAKAIQLLGETILAAQKAQKILGSNENDERARQLAAAEKEIAINYDRKRRLSAPEPGEVNVKAMQVLGETLLASEKAQKILGSNENDQRARHLASKEREIEVDYNRKKIYTAPEAGSVNAKVISVLGETVLASEKAQKILGSNEDDEIARKRAQEVKEIEVNLTRMMRYTLPDSHTKSLKVVQLLGESMIAGQKAEKILGSPMTRRQTEEMIKFDKIESEAKEKQKEKEALNALEASQWNEIFKSVPTSPQVKKTDPTSRGRSKSPLSFRTAALKENVQIASRSLSPKTLTKNRRAGFHEGIWKKPVFPVNSDSFTPENGPGGTSFEIPRGKEHSKSEGTGSISSMPQFFTFKLSPLDRAIYLWNKREMFQKPIIVLGNAIFPDKSNFEVIPLDKDRLDQFERQENLWQTVWAKDKPTFSVLEEKKVVPRLGEFETAFEPKLNVNSRINLICNENKLWLSNPTDAIAVATTGDRLTSGNGGEQKQILYYAGESLNKQIATFGNGLIQCITGGCIITNGHNLPQKWIIHFNDNFPDDGHIHSKYTELVWKILSHIDGHHIRSLSLSLFDVDKHGNNYVVILLSVLVSIRYWLENNENRSKCDKINICASEDMGNLVEILMTLGSFFS